MACGSSNTTSKGRKKSTNSLLTSTSIHASNSSNNFKTLKLKTANLQLLSLLSNKKSTNKSEFTRRRTKPSRLSSFVKAKTFRKTVRNLKLR